MKSISAKSGRQDPGIFLLVPACPVIFFFLHNFNQYKELILSTDVLLVLGIYALLAFILFFIFRKLLRLTKFQSIFSATLAISCFLFFGALQDFLSGYKKYPYLSNSFVLFALLVLLVLVIVFFARKKRAMIRATKYLGLIFIINILIELILLGAGLISGKTIHKLTDRMRSDVFGQFNTDSTAKPDIYHILFDSYTNGTALKEYWGFDNDIYPFLDSAGFYTIDSGFSNYKSTPYSVASIFNLQYLPGAEAYQVSNSSNFYIGQKVYSHNALFEFLKSQHYDFSIFSQLQNEKLMISLGQLGVTPPSHWLRNQTLERIYLNPWIQDKLKSLLGVKHSGRQPSLVTKSMNNFNDYNKKALDHLFAECQHASKRNAAAPPLFSFTHILMPHDPYLHDEKGNPVIPDDPGGINMKGYLAQVKYCNQIIRQITRCLLSDSTRRKIIIIQGDHGYRHYDNAPAIAEFGALNAVYFYNKDYLEFKSNLSHVNTYRIVANSFFNGHLPLLKDSIVMQKND